MAPPSIDLVTNLLGNTFSIAYTIGTGTPTAITLLINSSLTDSNVDTYSLGTSSGTYITPSLTNGVQYTAQIQQVDSAGSFVYSPRVFLTPTDVPLKPTINSIASGDGTLAFTVVAGIQQGGPLVSMTFPLHTSSLTGPSHASWIFGSGGVGGTSSGETPCNVTPTLNVANSYDVALLNLVNGVLHEVHVNTLNSVGLSAASDSMSNTPTDVPTPPSDLIVTPGDSLATFIFKPVAVPSYDPIQTVEVKLYSVNPSTLLNTYSLPIANFTASDGVYTYNNNLLNLMNGTLYQISVAVTQTSGGTTDYVDSTPFTPFKAPEKPVVSTVSQGDGFVTLTWSTHALNGLPLLKYEVYMNDAFNKFETGTETTISGLQNGTQYKFQVRAITYDTNASPNIVAENQYSAFSTDVNGTPFIPPSLPTGLTAESLDSSIKLTWDAVTSSNGSPIIQYEVYSYLGATPTLQETISSFTAGPLTSTVLELLNGTFYEFSVKAVIANPNGGVSKTESELTDLIAPSAPPPAVTGFDVVVGFDNYDNMAMQVSWTAIPSSYLQRQQIREYVITWVGPTAVGDDPPTPGEQIVPGYSSTSANIPMSEFTPLGLSYQFNIQAILVDPNTGLDVPGDPIVVPVEEIAFGEPGEPINVVITASAGNTLSGTWEAPAYIGADIQYTVNVNKYIGLQVDFQNTSYSESSNTSRTFTVTGLDNGARYLVRIQSKAVNPNGATNFLGGSYSQSWYVYKAPSAPRSLTATRGDQSATLSWLEPATPGGFAIAYYNVYVDNTYVGRTAADERTYTVERVGPLATDAALSNGTPYAFTVYAVVMDLNSNPNVPVEGAVSNTATATPVAAAGLVPGLNLVVGDRQLTLNYQLVSLVGTGMTFVKYMVQLNSGTAIPNGSNLSYTFSPLVNDTEYTLSVYAVTLDPNGATSNVDGAVASIIGIPSGDPIVSQLSLNGAGNVITATVNHNGGTVTECFCIATDDNQDYFVNLKSVLPNSLLNLSGQFEIPMTLAVPSFPSGGNITSAYVIVSNNFGMGYKQQDF